MNFFHIVKLLYGKYEWIEAPFIGASLGNKLYSNPFNLIFGDIIQILPLSISKRKQRQDKVKC